MRTDIELPDEVEPDVLGDIGADLSGPPVGDGPTPPGDVPDGQAVCQHVEDDGSVCGYTGTANQVHMHSIGKHRDRSTDKPPGKAKATRKGTSRSRAKSPTEKAASAALPVGDRATVYTSSLALAGLAAHLAIPAFDTYDLDVWNRGVPGVGAALDQLGAQNATVRQTCDLILGGGSGGAYLNLILSVSAIAMPVLAHHGVLPPSVGERFGQMIGAAAPEPSMHSRPEARESSPEYSGERVGVYPTPESAEDVLQYLGDVPPRIGADLGAMMMQGAGPTVVAVPDVAPSHTQPGPSEEPDGERGSEQLNPEHREPVAVP